MPKDSISKKTSQPVDYVARASARVAGFQALYELKSMAAQSRRSRKALSAPERREARLRKAKQRRAELFLLPAAERAVEEAKISRGLEMARSAQERAEWDAAAVRARMKEAEYHGGLPSDFYGRAGKLFVAGTRKAGKLRSGREKATMVVQSRRKLLALDYQYVEGNRQMRSLIRIDLDGIIEGGFEGLWLELDELVNEGRLKCMPHFAVGRELSGRLYGCHLWWILPSAVCYTAAGMKAPQRLFEGVARGLTAALLHLGADERASAGLVRGKNPLGWVTEFQTACWNSTMFPTLAEHAQYLDMSMPKETLARLAAEVQSRAGKAGSNSAFNAWQSVAYRLLQAAHCEGEQGYLEAIKSENRAEALFDWLSTRMPLDGMLDLLGASWSDRVAETIKDPREAAMAVLDKVIGYAAASWSPDKANEVAGRVRRGRFRHAVSGTLAERQGQGARLARAAVASENVDLVQDAIQRLRARGIEPTKKAVAEVTGLHRNTVSKVWNRCGQPCTSKCIDKKGGAEPVITINLPLASQDMTAVQQQMGIGMTRVVRVGPGRGGFRTFNRPVSQPEAFVEIAQSAELVSVTQEAASVFTLAQDTIPAGSPATEAASAVTVADQPIILPEPDRRPIMCRPDFLKPGYVKPSKPVWQTVETPLDRLRRKSLYRQEGA